MLTALLHSLVRTNGLAPADPFGDGAVEDPPPRFAAVPPGPPASAPLGTAPLATAPLGTAAPVAVPSVTDWPASRLALTNRLWGQGYIFPGGEAETLRLTRPLGVSAAASLLLVGVGAGGPALAVARNLGAWVTGVEVDPSLLAAARGLVSSASLGRKIAIRSWMPEVPLFEVRGHHHCLALHPFQGAAPEPILDAMAKALKPGGQLTIADLAAAAPLNVNDPVVRRWGQLERRDPAGVPLAANVGRMMGRIDLDVRIAEDISVRHSDQAMLGWRVMMRELGKPNRADAARLVAEAEMWLLRRRLIREGRLRMMRWHAMGPVRG